MLGLEHLKLNEKNRYSLKRQWKTIVIQAEVSRKDLFQILEQKVKKDVIERLQFGLTESGQDRPTSEKVLLDDSNIYAKFGKAMLIVGRSALKMKDFHLRDRCQEIERSITNTIQTIANILEENGYNPPKDKPDFPGLEEYLDNITREFLRSFPPEEDVTDYPSQDLLYIVRNIVIFREMLEMVEKLKQNIGEISK